MGASHLESDSVVDVRGEAGHPIPMPGNSLSRLAGRKIWLTLHLYLGLLLGCVLAIIGLTGSLLVFWLRRRITLLRGEAWFSVAADPARPFVVEAAGGNITALGTAFDVALETGETTRVTVTEHRVLVSSGGKEVIVKEGQETAYAREVPARAPSRADVARLTAWRRGKLIVENEPLGTVLAALSRYRHGFVTCLRPTICARRVSGVFGTEDPLRSIAEIETYLGLKAFRLSDYLIVLHE